MMPNALARALRPGAWLTVALAAFPPPLAAAGEFRALAYTGQLSGVGAATFAGPPLSAAFDAANRVVLSASIPFDGSLALGVWTEEAGALVPKLHDRAPAPGTPAGVNVRRLGLGTPTVRQGWPTIVAHLDGGAQAAYVDQPGAGLRVASRSGKIIDASAGVEVVGFHGPNPSAPPDPIANADGDVLMYGTLRGGPLGATGGFGAWVERAGSSQLVFHANTTLPGIAGGGKFGDFVGHDLAFDDEGHVATIHSFSGGQGVWMFDPAIPGLNPHVANTGTVRDGVAVSGITGLRLAAGRGAFHSGPWGASVSSAIFAKQFGVLELVAAENRPAPGFGPGAMFRTFRPKSMAIDGSGLLAFTGDVADPATPDGSSGAIWYDAPGLPPELALRLDDLPGSQSRGLPWTDAYHLVMNDRRQLAFQDDSQHRALWWFDPTLGAQRIAGIGDQITLTQNGADVLKTLVRVEPSSYLYSGLAPSQYLSNSGEVVFIAWFDDNTHAAVVWSPVPEPGAAGLAAMAIIARGAHRLRPRRR